MPRYQINDEIQRYIRIILDSHGFLSMAGLKQVPIPTNLFG